MSRKTSSAKQSMSPMQERAVLVCILCVLVVLVTFGITVTLLKKQASEPAAPSVSEPTTDPAPDGENLSEHYQINEASGALLPETADAGEDYLNQTLFLGDSNTVRLYNNGLISLQQFCAKEGIGTQAALSEDIVTFKKDSNHYTIPQAVAMMKPRRVVMTFGTNDAGMEVQDFIAHYTALVQAIQQSYPYTDIIVNTVPPIPADHSSYPNMDQARIDDFNMALLQMCEQLGVRFLNSAEVLKGDDGYGIADYYNSSDIHLKSNGLKLVLNYIRTHALQTEDRRPDTNGIPTRTMEYVSNPSSAVAAPSSSVSSSSESASSSTSSSSSESSSSESSSESKKYEALYRVDKNGGGTLSTGSNTGNNSLTYSVSDPSKSITVTAVPSDGHVFVKWSDGITSKTRTDSNFKQNLDVTAVFGTAGVHITSEGKGAVGSSYTFKANLSGSYAKVESLRWYANGQEVKAAAGKSNITVVVDNSMLNASYKIQAVISYNDCRVSSNTLTIVIGNGVSSESSSSSNSSGSSSSSSSSASNAGASSGSTSQSGASSSASASSSSSSSTGSSSASSSSHSTSSSSTAASSASSGSSNTESKTESESQSTKAESKAESKSEETAQKSETKAESSASKEAAAE